jgi:hypothetical protein
MVGIFLTELEKVNGIVLLATNLPGAIDTSFHRRINFKFHFGSFSKKNQIRTLEKIKRCNDLDENPLEINNIVGFANLLKEFNANNDVIKEYTTKLNTLCWKNNPLVKKTKEESKEIKIQKMIQKALAN